MKIKAKGFTVLEVIITLAITVMVLSVAYTFFFSNKKTLSTTEIKSTLQSEAEIIEKTLINLGTQSSGIDKLNNIKADDSSNNYLSLEVVLADESENYKRVVENIILNYENGDKSIINIQNGVMTIKVVDINDNIVEAKKILSQNIKQFKIRPLDVRMVDDLGSARFSEAPGLEFNIVLAMKKGYSNVEYPISTIVKFRNK